MSRCDLDVWPFDLELLLAFKLCTKFDRNRIIYRWVIDNLSCFLQCNFRGWSTFTERLTNLGEDIGRSWLHKSLFQSSDILLHFQTWAAKSWVMLKTTPNFARFGPLLWKLGEWWARSLCQLLKLCLQPNLRNTFDDSMAIHCARWIANKNKKRKKFHG